MYYLLLSVAGRTQTKGTGVRNTMRIAAVGIFAAAGMAFAGRPLAIDDADPADPGQFEFSENR